ncbi:UPF0175 family protein [Desulfobacterales bacterium HSG2]|nr:UPF0175 family protein [Desulfobacterales bacterium HSG2]
MQTLQITLPDFISTDTREITFVIASKFYEKGKLSLGQAADVAGVSKRTFMELLGSYDVSIFNYPPEDIESDFKHKLADRVGQYRHVVHFENTLRKNLYRRGSLQRVWQTRGKLD